MRTTTLASAIGVVLLGASFSPQHAIAASANQLNAQKYFASTADANAVESYFIRFTEAGLVEYAGGVSGMAPTSPRAAGTRKLDVHSPASVAYGQYLQSQRTAHVSAIESAIGKPLAVTHGYAITMNAVAANITAAQAATIASLPGVASVKLAGEQHLATYRGPEFIGADTIWDGTNTPSGVGTRGQGILVADLDTGANSTHPSFANDPTCGFNAGNPKLQAVDCSTSAAGVCNGPDPEAAQGNGHGVHTASTAAGNTIDNTVTPAPQLPDGVTMSGVAPCASIKSYKVCQTNTCGGADIAAGIENAIADQADVLNFSISGGTSPWNDNDRDFLDAVNANVFVAAAAGNTSATITDPVGQVNHRGPWVLTVAASTQDEIIGPGLTVTGPGTPPAILDGVSLNPGSTTDPATTTDMTGLTLRLDPNNLIGCTADGGFAANYFDNSVAVIRRGTCAFTEKITNAFDAGAQMVIIANNVPAPINMDTTGAPAIPAFSIDMAPGDALIDFINPGVSVDTIFFGSFDTPAGAIGDYATITVNQTQGDVLADFSFRGPTPPPYSDLTKPDITAPGVNIYAALTTAEGSYGFLSGTSMSTPHMTGSAALIRAVHPDWSVEEVKSALQTTAKKDGFQEDGVTSWNTDDVGNGRVDLTKAALAGLTLDETYANFVAANPSGGSIDMKTLNIPSVRNTACDAAGCSWTRTVANKLATSGTWAVSTDSDGFTLTATPASFTLAPGATQAVTITAVPAVSGVLAFGNVNFHENSGQSPDQHITAAVQLDGGPPAPVDYCVSGTCDFQIDEFTSGNFNLLGGGTSPFVFLWLNQFTPDPGEYPITLNTVDTIFANTTTTLGDAFDMYIFQDDDTDPSNGATLVSSVTGQTITVQNALQTITIPSGVTLNGPGDILIAFVTRTPSANPASADDGVAFAGHSWLGGLGGVGSPPDLAALDMVLTPDALASFTHNWIIRGHGTNGGGLPVDLTPAK